MSKPYDAAFRPANIPMSTVEPCSHDPLGWHPERGCECQKYPDVAVGIPGQGLHKQPMDTLTDMAKEITGLPTDAAARKNIPVATGFVSYFPKAMVAVAECSKKGNDQHNPGKPLFWDRSKSGDEADALMRHFLERGTIDTDGIRHSAKLAWRAMALLQKELEEVERQNGNA